MLRALLAVALTFCLTAVAGDLTPEKAAQVMRDRQKAIDEVAKKYGNKKPSELSNHERGQLIRDQNDAVAKVYEKAGVDAKEFARFEATESREERAAVNARSAAIEKKEADDKKAAEAAAKASKTEENGVIVERNTDAKDFDAPAAPKAKKKGKAR